MLGNLLLAFKNKRPKFQCYLKLLQRMFIFKYNIATLPNVKEGLEKGSKDLKTELSPIWREKRDPPTRVGVQKWSRQKLGEKSTHTLVIY